jgi:hypothetical protein
MLRGWQRKRPIPKDQPENVDWRFSSMGVNPWESIMRRVAPMPTCPVSSELERKRERSLHDLSISRSPED